MTDTDKKTCENSGHLWGPGGQCVFCKAPKPALATPAPPEREGREEKAVELLKEMFDWASEYARGPFPLGVPNRVAAFLSESAQPEMDEAKWVREAEESMAEVAEACGHPLTPAQKAFKARADQPERRYTPQTEDGE